MANSIDRAHLRCRCPSIADGRSDRPKCSCRTRPVRRAMPALHTVPSLQVRSPCRDIDTTEAAMKLTVHSKARTAALPVRRWNVFIGCEWIAGDVPANVRCDGALHMTLFLSGDGIARALRAALLVRLFARRTGSIVVVIVGFCADTQTRTIPCLRTIAVSRTDTEWTPFRPLTS